VLAECWPIIVKIKQDLEKVPLNLCITPVLVEFGESSAVGAHRAIMQALANISQTSFIYWIYCPVIAMK
jgi:hypothetical protein